MFTTRLSVAFVLLVVCAPRATAAEETAAPVVASHEDAFITHDEASLVWSIGSRDLELVVGLDQSRTLTLQRLTNRAAGRDWDLSPGTDVSLTISGEHVTLGATSAFAFLGADATESDQGVVLTFKFEQRERRLKISRSYACYPNSPTIETWTTIQATDAGGPVLVSDLVGWQLTLPYSIVRWLGGLRGDTADNEEAGAFALAEYDLAPGERVEIGADGRSTEQFVPFTIVEGAQDKFYGGLMWSGAWRLAFERIGADGDRLRITASFPAVASTAAPGRPVEVPHTFFGLTTQSTTDESGALRQFVIRGIRHGRPFQPLVTYNTWFAHGTEIDEALLQDEMRHAAALGVELFVVDAGWYLGAGAGGAYDFGSGLGTWTVDPDRFPSGLGSLADLAHQLGMKFGLWVEPERVALDTVDQPSLARESWLATHGGDYGAPLAGQICLSGPQARQWVLDRLVSLIDAAQPDYLKWDNNFWINCDRSGHGHGPADGAFAHVHALYGLLDELRTRYPDLLIENVSGGGNRLDFGMLAYTDAAWMDDRTAPSTHVRHNLEGLTFAFPPAYLLSFVIDHESESIHGASDLSLVMRSRMPGILGMTYSAADLEDELAAGLSAGIREYKTVRDILSRANATLLSDQAPVDDASWDVLQELADDGRDAVVFAFKADDSNGRLIVRPRNLAAAVTYDVRSLDVGAMGSARGDQLMQDGVELVHTGGSRAHIIVLTAR